MTDNECVLLDHGSGGIASQELISKLFLKYLDDPILGSLEDSAVLPNQPGSLAFSTDSYVVDPLFFPGGNIGTLAVHGTINDLAMRGARPLCLSLGLILEEGLPLESLERIIISIAECCKSANVPVVTGDTKVVPKGKCDKIFINTSGIGFVADDVSVSSTMAKEGDAILLSGSMGDHGITIMTRRAGISLEGDLASDSAALHDLVALLLEKLPPGSLHTMRDPTRGGVATSLNEIAEASQLTAEIIDQDIPVHTTVRAACEIMGLDPFYLANEGKCLLLVDPKHAEQALQLMQSTEVGKEAAIIGSLTAKQTGRVVLRTAIGGSRVISPLHGEPLPRIC